MRAKEFLLLSESQELFEINMSPTSLQKLASTIDARAGMEFEMIVPNVQNDDGDEMEPDYDQDERCYGISDAREFFSDGDYNSRRDVDTLVSSMQDDFWEWLSDKINSEWEDDQDGYIREWIRENVDPEQWMDRVNDETDEDQAFDEYAAEQIEDRNSDAYQSAWEAYEGEKQDDFEETDWLDEKNLGRMSRISDEYDIQWPHWTSVGGGEISIDSVADEFSDAIDRPVNASSRYHGGRREAGHYVVEPDSSLSPDDSDDAGLEFVSPPLTIAEMISDLNKVSKWAGRMGCYTNDSTGLHINVSIPDFSLDKLDYTKLALLLGDQYILDQFGRLGNSYAKSALDLVRTRAQQRPEDVPAMLEKMRQGLASMAGKMIHSGATDKYTSINTKDGYVEFRSPGGDWLGEYAADPGKIVNTLLRFVVALDAACDPEKYKEEYAKKLFQLLSGDNNKYNDSVKYFTDYASGKIPKAALKSFVRQVQLQRQTKKQPSAADSSRDEKQYQVRDASGYSMLVKARNTNAAMQWARENYPDKFRNVTDVVLYDNPIAGSTADLQQRRAAGGFTGAWKIVDGSGRELYRFSGIGNQQADANRVAQQWLEQHRYTGAVDVLPIMG